MVLLAAGSVHILCICRSKHMMATARLACLSNRHVWCSALLSGLPPRQGVPACSRARAVLDLRPCHSQTSGLHF